MAKKSERGEEPVRVGGSHHAVSANETAGLGPVINQGYCVNSTVLRANRFTPTPWQEVYGSQIRYELPATLTRKIRQAIS